MQKVFIGLLADAVNLKILMVAQAVVDFVYLSQFHFFWYELFIFILMLAH